MGIILFKYSIESWCYLMLNLFEIAYDIFKPYADNEKKPLNVLEVANLWFFLAISNNTMRNEELAYNLAQDSELKQKLKMAKDDVHLPIVEEISKLLKEEGIPLPEDTPVKPTGDFHNIPYGAKLNDEEIANLMSFNLLIGVTYATRGLTESIRADVGQTFFRIVLKKTAFGLTVKELMRKRNWLRFPPHYKD